MLALVTMAQTAFGQAGPGAIFQGENILMLKQNQIFKNSNVKIMTGDTDDPTAVAKSADQGSLYIREGSGTLYQKADNGLSTNWNSLLIGPVGSGTDECVARWDGTGVPLLQNSLLCITDAGAATGLVSAIVGNISISGNTLASSNANGNIVLNPNGTGQVNLPDLTASRPLKLDASNNATASQINLASTNDVTGLLPPANGGLGTDVSAAANGSLLYKNGAAYSASAAGAAGQALVSGGAGSPTWFAPTATRCAFYGTNGVLAEDAGCVYDAATDTMTLAGPLIVDDTAMYIGNRLGTVGTYVGLEAGLNAGVASEKSVGVGYRALRGSVSGMQNTAVGFQALFGTTGNANTAIGSEAGVVNTTGVANTMVGSSALFWNNGDFNTSLGYNSVYNTTTGSSNVGLGATTLFSNLTGSNNTAIGREAGFSALGSGNVFLGYQAGYSETGSNKLYIDNSSTATPLIGGDFSTNVVTVTGELIVSGLTASLPTKTNGSKQLVSGAIDLASGTEVTGVVPAARLTAMVGASGVANGVQGAVPAPLIANQFHFLRGDGTWQETPSDAPDVTYTPTTGADWTDPDPANVQEGLDDLAARVSGGVLSSVGTIDSVAKSANGATVSGTALILQNADNDDVGLVSIAAQSLAGIKTFINGIIDSTLTAGRCMLVGTSGRHIDDAGCTFNTTTDVLTVGAIRPGSTTQLSAPGSMTTADRLASTPVEGDFVWDTDLNTMYQYSGTAWVAVSSASPSQYWAGALSGADVDLGTTADGGTWNNAANASLTTLSAEVTASGGISCSAIGSGNVGVTCTGLTIGLKKVCMGGLRTMVGTNIDQSFRIASCDGSSVCSTTTADDYSETWSDTSTLASNRSGPNYTCRTVDVLASGAYTFNLQETTDAVTAATTNNILASSVQRKIYMTIEDASPLGAGSTLKKCSFGFGGAGSIGSTCTSTPCTIYAELTECVTSVTRVGTGSYEINFNTGYWTGAQTYNCSQTTIDYGVNGCYPTSTSGSTRGQNIMYSACKAAGAGLENASISVMCEGY